MLLDQAIDLGKLESLGFDDKYPTIKVKNFKDSKRDNSNDLESTNPIKCEPIGALFTDSPKIGADLLLAQSYQNNLPYRLLIANIYTFASEEKSNSEFAKIKSVANECGSILLKRSAEAVRSDYWQSAESGPDNIIRAVGDKYPTAYAIGKAQSAIYLIVVMDENLKIAKSKLEEAINLVSTGLTNAQS